MQLVRIAHLLRVSKATRSEFQHTFNLISTYANTLKRQIPFSEKKSNQFISLLLILFCDNNSKPVKQNFILILFPLQSLI